MPNLNLIDDEGLEESTETVQAPARKKGGGGGGIGKILVIVLILVVVAGGVFLLNKYGIVKLWGKKTPPPVAVVQPEPFPQEPFPAEEAIVDTGSGIEFVDTPPIAEVPPPAPAPPPSASDKLASMKGNYTIQVSAWKDRKTAEKYVRLLEEAGYPAFLEPRDLKGGSWYTVRIGRYPTVKEARKAVDSFALEIRSNYWIDKTRMQ